MKKKTLAIILVILIILLGGAAVYVATQLQTRQAVVPTAPVSKPSAAEWVGSDGCTVLGEATEAEETKSVLEGTKKAFKNVTSNTPGHYTLTTEMDAVSKSQIYVYSMDLKNTGDGVASSVVIKDPLADMPVTFMDAVAGCTYNATDFILTCNTSINPGETKTFSFRVKADDAIANGTVITNTANVTYSDGSLDLTKDLSVSTVVGCNHTCTTDEECTTGLVCDGTSGKCRKAACVVEEDCSCTVTGTITGTVTRTPTNTVTTTVTRVITSNPTLIATEEATPTELPASGILDLPGAAAFGGGLVLAVVGILLAL